MVLFFGIMENNGRLEFCAKKFPNVFVLLIYKNVRLDENLLFYFKYIFANNFFFHRKFLINIKNAKKKNNNFVSNTSIITFPNNPQILKCLLQITIMYIFKTYNF